MMYYVFCIMIALPTVHTQHRAAGGPLDLDNTYTIGNGEKDAVPVLRPILKKKYMDSVYWQGECLVLRRVHELKDFALIMKRYLEEDGQVIRLVSVHRNLVTNEETESISFFSKVGPSPHDPAVLFPRKGGNSAPAGKAPPPPPPPTGGDSPSFQRAKSVSFGTTAVID